MSWRLIFLPPQGTFSGGRLFLISFFLIAACLSTSTTHSGILERQLLLETSYQLDGTGGLTTLVVGFDINSIITHKLRHRRFATVPLTEVTHAQAGKHTHTVLKQSPAATKDKLQ